MVQDVQNSKKKLIAKVDAERREVEIKDRWHLTTTIRFNPDGTVSVKTD